MNARRPNNGFEAAIVRTSFSISEVTGGRPGTFAFDNYLQYRSKRLRCHAITVLGRTITSADFRSFQIMLRPIQKRVCHYARPFSEFEFRRIIDDYLQAENRTGFVVHLQSSCFAVFDANAGKSLGGEVRQITDDIALKDSAEFSSKKAHDILVPEHRVMWLSNRGKSPSRLSGL